MGTRMKRGDEYWIYVVAEDGMFPDEKAISIKLFDGRSVSLFAHSSLIQQKGGKDYLKVYFIESDPSLNRNRVLLPTETFETSSRWIDVPSYLGLS